MYKFREATEDDFQGICDRITSKEELFYIYLYGQYPFTAAQLTQLAEVRTELTVVVDGNAIIGFANRYNYEPRKLAFIGSVVVAKKYPKFVTHLAEQGRSLPLYIEQEFGRSRTSLCFAAFVNPFTSRLSQIRSAGVQRLTSLQTVSLIRE